MGWVQPIDLPNGTKTKTFASPVRINSQTLSIRMRPPGLGEHNEEIFSDITQGAK
jgi:formyl-CoA transferase